MCNIHELSRPKISKYLRIISDELEKLKSPLRRQDGIDRLSGEDARRYCHDKDGDLRQEARQNGAPLKRLNPLHDGRSGGHMDERTASRARLIKVRTVLIGFLSFSAISRY